MATQKTATAKTPAAPKQTWQAVAAALVRAGFKKAEERAAGGRHGGFETMSWKSYRAADQNIHVTWHGKWVHHWHRWTEEELAAHNAEREAAYLAYATALAAAGYYVRMCGDRPGFGPLFLDVTLS